MELTGNTADRWEQISNKMAEIASHIAEKQELIKSISSTLDDLNLELNTERDTLEKLGNLAYKEVLREESGTLNDETPVTPESKPVITVPITEAPSTDKDKHQKLPAKKSAKKPTESSKQSESPLNIETTDSETEDKQPHQQEG